MIRPKEHLKIVPIPGIFSRSGSVELIFTPKAWHSSLVYNGRSEFVTHIKASIPSLDLSSSCAIMRTRVVAYVSPRSLPFVISSNFRLLPDTVTPLRIASMVNETKRNLQTMISQHKIVHGMGIVDAPTHISEILSGITLRMSSRRPLDIASGSGSISNFFCRYLFTSWANGY